jgi:hypothetical protein
MSRSTTWTEGPVCTITFRPEPGVDGLRAVRAVLKLALRAFGLRCIGITAHPPVDVETDE